MGCSKCGSEEQIVQQPSQCCSDPALNLPPCPSNQGKFHDKTIADFTVPKVGSSGKIYVAQANLWSACQWIGVCIGKNKYAFFKIIETGNQSLKVQNGCTKGDINSGILGNPEPGLVVEEGAILFPAPPTGCSDELSLKFVHLLETYGADSVIKILKETDALCFTATPELEDSETAHLFGGTFVDCDCAPEPSFWPSCLRKLKEIFTGQSGKTLCMPEVATVDGSDDSIDGENVPKRLAYFDGRGCLKKGEQVKNVVTNLQGFVYKNTVAYEGITTLLTPSYDSLGIPEQINGRQIYAIWECLCIITGPAGCQIDAEINGTQIQKAYTGPDSGGAQWISRTVVLPAASGDSVLLQGKVILGTPVTQIVKITLVGFYV